MGDYKMKGVFDTCHCRSCCAFDGILKGIIRGNDLGWVYNGGRTNIGLENQIKLDMK